MNPKLQYVLSEAVNERLKSKNYGFSHGAFFFKGQSPYSFKECPVIWDKHLPSEKYKSRTR